MHEVDEVKKILTHLTVAEIATEDVALEHSIGRILASHVSAKVDVPAFRQSAMDGYAIRFEDVSTFSSLKIVGEIAAGTDITNYTLQSGECFRIYTGAAVPMSADTVVQQEWVQEQQQSIVFTSNLPIAGANIRGEGSQCKAGSTLMTKGSKLTPASLAFLAGAGIYQVQIYRNPKVGVLNTGSELIHPSQALPSGKIYESNSFALRGALQQLGLTDIYIEQVTDDKQLLKQALQTLLNTCDMIIITGGVSVGKYDYVHDVLHELGVQQLVHGVKQKPGKPLYIGIKNKQLIFGLPGNPASVLVCFYQYVLISLYKIMQRPFDKLRTLQVPLMNTYNKKAGLTHFLKGMLHEDGVEILPDQESYKMNSFAIANALVEIPSGSTCTEQGELVRVYLLC